MRLNGDIFLAASGIGSIGVNGDATDAPADPDTITPFRQIHFMSGVFHDPTPNTGGQSGVVRWDNANSALELSTDGGETFTSFVTGATAVTSVGVVGGANLTGDVDFAGTTSGFLIPGDSAGSSPIKYDLDWPTLSGFFAFPSQGFNSSVINSVVVNDALGRTDMEGPIQGVINLQGVNGIDVDIDGQNVFFGISGVTGNQSVVRGYSQDLTPSAFTFTVTHSLNTENVTVQVYDSSDFLTQADDVEILSSTQVRLTFNSGFTGKVVITGFD